MTGRHFEGWVRLRGREAYPVYGRIAVGPGWVAVRDGDPHPGYGPPPPDRDIWTLFPTELVLEVCVQPPTGTDPWT